MSAATAIRTPQLARGRVRPELELLFAAVVGPRTQASRRHLDALLIQPLDWEFLLHFADQHGLGALFFWSAQEFSHAIPAPWFERLKTAYDRNVRKNLLLWHLILELQALLESRGVECIALKGPALAAGVYGDVALREFSDLDLLVRPRDVTRARNILVSAGFRPALEIHPKHERAYLKSANELAFHRGPHRNILELQWQITPHFYAVDFHVEKLFQRATLTRLGGAQCRTLAVEDLVLTLSVHAAKHAWGRLAWICDIARLLRTQHLNWYEVERRAERFGIARVLLVTLGLARNFFQATLPCHIGEKIKHDRQVCVLTREVEETILYGQPMDVAHRNYFLLMCRVRERWRDRLRLITRLAFARESNDWSSAGLRDSFPPAYVFLRACKMMAKLCGS